MTQQKIDDGGVGVPGTGWGDARCAKCGAQLEVISTRMWLAGKANEGDIERFIKTTSAGLGNQTRRINARFAYADAMIAASQQDTNNERR